MARIRTIKPEFPKSETIGRLSRDARLLFIQLWTEADDEGRARASSRMLASLLYPYDDDARDLMEGWLRELEREGCIRRYIAENAQYLEIINWQKHQKIDRPSKSRLPPPTLLLASPREHSRALDADLGPRTLDLGPKEENPPNPPSGGKRAKRAVSAKRSLPEDFGLTEERKQCGRDRGWNDARTTSEFVRFTDSALAHNRTYANWDAAWRNWTTSNFQETSNGGRINGHRQHPAERAFQLADELDAALERQADATGSSSGSGPDAISLLNWQRSS